MTYLIVRHKVADFAKWKLAYDGHSPAREAAGLKQVHLLRSMSDPNEVILLFEVNDMTKARTFILSAGLKAALDSAGVVDKPNVYFLQ